MYPVIFEIFTIQARSYYLLWAFALLLFLYMSMHRAVGKYGLEASGTMSALLWVYITAISGAFFGVVIEKLPLIISGGESYAILFSGGSSACMGILIGGIAGLWKLHTEKISVSYFADAVAIPLSLMLCIGRLGCFLEGCCEGKIITARWYAVHFPCDMPQIYRFPSQAAEAVVLGFITIFLFAVEKKYRDKFCGALLFPLFMILYGSYRIYFDRFRALPVQRAFHSGYAVSALAVAAGTIWLISTVKNK